jgi:hypothetical protein
MRDIRLWAFAGARKKQECYDAPNEGMRSPTHSPEKRRMDGAPKVSSAVGLLRRWTTKAEVDLMLFIGTTKVMPQIRNRTVSSTKQIPPGRCVLSHPFRKVRGTDGAPSVSSNRGSVTPVADCYKAVEICLCDEFFPQLVKSCLFKSWLSLQLSICGYFGCTFGVSGSATLRIYRIEYFFFFYEME